MKALFAALAIAFISIGAVSGQVPESFKYQAVVRDPSGEIIASQQVTLIIEILKGSALGPVVCNEAFTPVTNEFGIVNLEIGSQDPSAFESIDWSDGPYFVRVSVNGNSMGTSELLSVPYALYAKNSGNAGLWISQGNNIYYSQGRVGVGSGLISNSAILDVTSTTKGFLPPRMTYDELQAIESPANGLIVFCTDCESNGTGALTLFMYGGWYKLSSTCLGPVSPSQGIHDTTQTEITWRWNAVAGATGYKWNTTADYMTAQDMGADTFKVETGLNCGTEYHRYVWAYSTTCNSSVSDLFQVTAACVYGIPCPGIPTVEYEGHVYNTVQIGSQCWLKENLDVGEQINGSVDQTDNGIIEKYCYDDNPSNCVIYGGLYKWEEIMNYTTLEGTKGICPDGWHIPTDSEWCSLTSYIDETVECNLIGGTGTDACLKMKATSGWNGGGNGTNESGFTSFPAGTHYPTHYENLGNGIDFWTSTLQPNPGAYYWVNYFSNDMAGRYILDLEWNCAVSLRCLKDE